MGCRVCRARKVKCDGRPDGCRNCERLQLDCLGDSGLNAPGHASTSPVSLRKIRTYRSCNACRSSKTKCDGERPKCSRCTTKNVDCEYDGGAAPRWTKSLGHQSQMALTDDGESSHGGSNEGEGQDGMKNDDERLEEQYRQHVAADKMTPISDMPPPSRPLSRHGSIASSVFPADGAVSDALAWLLTPDLPTSRNLRRVIESYFANVHPLRCFAFVHKPSFMRQLDQGFTTDDEKALLFIMCAHGAKFHVLSLKQTDPSIDLAFHRAAGNQWAKKAEYLMLANFGKVSVHRLMAAVLLYDYHFRQGEFTQALMVSGLAVRMAHALRINTEYSTDIMCTEHDNNAPSVAARESRRRLMWACYVLDAWTGSGVDQLTLLRENDIKIQLPCNERNFGLRIPSVTETLGVGHVLQFLPPAIVPPRPAANMGIMAYYVRIVTIWKRVVKYVNNLALGPPPWLPESEFSALDADLRLWRRELPEFVEYSADTIYARLDSNQLGSLMLIHCTYHHNFIELYKFSMPDLFKLEQHIPFPPEHMEFIKVVQADSYFHAQKIAHILAEAAEHGPRLLSDALLPFFVYDSSRVMLYYVSKLLDPARVDSLTQMREAVKAVESNRRILSIMSTLFPIAESLSATIERWLFKMKKNLERKARGTLSPLEAMTPGRDVYSVPASTTMSTPATSEFALPSISFMQRSGVGEKRDYNGDTVSPTHAANHAPGWDRTSAAHQLVGLSQESPHRAGLLHERPVQPQVEEAPVAAPATEELQNGDLLELGDLQDFFPWDMYGLMEMGEAMSQNGMDDAKSQSWGMNL